MSTAFKMGRCEAIPCGHVGECLPMPSEMACKGSRMAWIGQGRTIQLCHIGGDCGLSSGSGRYFSLLKHSNTLVDMGISFNMAIRWNGVSASIWGIGGMLIVEFIWCVYSVQVFHWQNWSTFKVELFDCYMTSWVTPPELFGSAFPFVQIVKKKASGPNAYLPWKG